MEKVVFFFSFYITPTMQNRGRAAKNKGKGK